jgi:SAM-dependent methyltransferase
LVPRRAKHACLVAPTAVAAAIAVYSIDHVDDFARAASELKRVLKPGGALRMEVHYHPPTRLEPQVLDDDNVLAHLGDLGLEKVSEEVPGGVCRHSDDPSELIVIWRTTDQARRETASLPSRTTAPRRLVARSPPDHDDRRIDGRESAGPV